MVRGVALTLLVLSYPALGESLSYKEYQQRLGAGQERLDYSKQLIGHDQIHTLVPETRTGNQPEARPENAPSPTVGDGVETQSGSQGEQASQTQTRPGGQEGDREERTRSRRERDRVETESRPAADNVRPPRPVATAPKARPEPAPASPYEYVSPSLRAGTGAGTRNQVRVVRPDSNGRILFGIPIGAEIPVSLDQAASNVQPGLIVLKVEKTIPGRKQDLPQGSQLFARSSAVIGSERLYLNVSQGIAPDGTEFTLRGVILDRYSEPGLAARVVSDGKTLARASSEGLNTFGQQLLEVAPGEGAAAAAAQAGAGAVLSEQAQEDRATNGRPAYVVVADPQPGVVQVEATF